MNQHVFSNPKRLPPRNRSWPREADLQSSSGQSGWGQGGERFHEEGFQSLRDPNSPAPNETQAVIERALQPLRL